jgi:hypothetical protein
MGRRRKKNSHFIMFPWDLWDSYAWGQITNAARVAYIGIRRQKDRPGLTDLKFPYGDAERLMRRKTFKAAIDELLEWGFIMMEQRGGMRRRTNIYSLSEEWRIRSEKKK